MPRPGFVNLSGEYHFFTGLFKGYDDIKDFETYYQNAQQGMDNKEDDYVEERINEFKSFINDLVSKTVEFNNNALDKNGKAEFIGLVTRMQKEVQSPLKKLLRTMILDTYATMAGDLDSVNADNKKNLDQVTAMTELYDAILNEQDKKEIQDAFKNGEAGKFLTNTDHDMSGNFSKTLRALYGKYREPDQTPKEKEKWKELCNSYAVRPYTHAVSGKVKQEESSRRSRPSMRCRRRRRKNRSREKGKNRGTEGGG